MSGPRLELIAPHDEPALLFRRAFRAPATLVFRAWTEPEHLRHWRVPHGFGLAACEVDLRAGGGYRLVRRAPDGSRHAFRGRYRQIERPGRPGPTFTCEAAPGTEVLDEVTSKTTAAPPWSPGEPPSRSSRRGNPAPPQAPSAGWRSATGASTSGSKRSYR